MGKLLFAALAFSLSASGADRMAPEEGWRQDMRKMKSYLTDLLPLASTTQNFNKAENAVKIQKLVEGLRLQSGSLKHFKSEMKVDPTVDFVEEALRAHVGAIQTSLNQGRRDYARYLVLNTMSYCIECHTRNDKGAHFIAEDTFASGESGVERIEFLISTRRFLQAQEEIKKLLAKKNKPLFADEKLIRYGLTMAIRYFNDPREAEMLIEAGAKAPSLPFYLKSALKTWDQSVKDWKKAPAATTTEQKLKGAQELLDRASDLVAESRSAHAGDVEVLRAQGVLMDLFDQKLTPETRAKVLFLLGRSYEMMTDHFFWTLHEPYYIACIKTLPHSGQALACYHALEESDIAGFTGSRGTDLPADVVRQLEEMKKLATPPAP